MAREPRTPRTPASEAPAAPAAANAKPKVKVAGPELDADGLPKGHMIPAHALAQK